MRRRLIWPLAVPFALVGSQAAHWVAYRLAGSEPSGLLARTGHSYERYAPSLLACATAIALGAFVFRAVGAYRNQSSAIVPGTLFAVLPVVTFVLQEHLERLFRDGVFPVSAVLEPTFRLGLLLQIPFALAAYLLTHALGFAADGIGRALRAEPRKLVPGFALSRPGRGASVTLDQGVPVSPWVRGPPVPALGIEPSRTRRCRPLPVLVALVAALAVAPAAAAHATLLSTDPPNGATVQQAPRTVTLRFSEPITTSLGSVRAFDPAGRRVDTGSISRPAGDAVSIGIAGLHRGTFIVAWRVVSADTHPVHGAFTFSVGAPSANAGAIAARALKGQDTPATTSIGFAVVRFLDFALLLGCCGGALVLLAIRRFLAPRVTGRLCLILAGLGLGLVPVSLAGLIFQGADAEGFSPLQALHWSVFSSVADTRFGVDWLARAALGAALCAAALAARRPGRTAIVASGLAALLGVGLAITPAQASHASVGTALTMTVDTVHVVAGSVWTGGLFFVAFALLLAGEARWSAAAKLVPRFSAMAVLSVVLLLVAGVVNSYLEVRAWRGLWETTYGVLLLAKIGLVLPLLALGAYNNRYAVPRLRAEISSRLEQLRFLRVASVELGLFVAIVGVTAVLVTEQPAKSQVAATGPFTSTSTIGPFELNLIVDPARAGANVIHLYLLGKTGQPASVAETTLDASLPQRGIGPLSLDTRLAGPGHYAAYGAVLPIPGDWRLRITVRRGDFDQWTTQLSMPIRGAG